MKVLQLPPSKIKFTQNSIGMCFQDGDSVNETCENIVLGYYDVDDLPRIKVYVRRKNYYSLDNRRLYVFRVLDELDFIEKIEVKLVDRNNYRTVTTKNRGCHVTLRRGKNSSGDWITNMTYQHCPCNKSNFTYPEWWNRQHRCHINQIKGPQSFSNHAVVLETLKNAKPAEFVQSKTDIISSYQMRNQFFPNKTNDEEEESDDDEESSDEDPIDEEESSDEEKLDEVYKSNLKRWLANQHQGTTINSKNDNYGRSASANIFHDRVLQAERLQRLIANKGREANCSDFEPFAMSHVKTKLTSSTNYFRSQAYQRERTGHFAFDLNQRKRMEQITKTVPSYHSTTSNMPTYSTFEQTVSRDWETSTRQIPVNRHPRHFSSTPYRHVRLPRERSKMKETVDWGSWCDRIFMKIVQHLFIGLLFCFFFLHLIMIIPQSKNQSRNT